MASPEHDIGTGLLLSFASGPTALNSRKITDFTLPESLVDLVQDSNQDTTGGHTYITKDLQDNGSLELTLQHWQDYDYPADIGKSGTLTVTTPSGATYVFTGILEKYTPQQTQLDDEMLADVSIKVSGDIAITAAA